MCVPVLVSVSVREMSLGARLVSDWGETKELSSLQAVHSQVTLVAWRTDHHNTPHHHQHFTGRGGGEGGGSSNILNTFQLSQSSGGNKPSINPKSSRWLRKSVKALFYTCKLKKIYPTNMIYMESVWVQCINKFHCIMCVSVQQCTAMYNSLTMSE